MNAIQLSTHQPQNPSMTKILSISANIWVGGEQLYSSVSQGLKLPKETYTLLIHLDTPRIGNFFLAKNLNEIAN